MARANHQGNPAVYLFFDQLKQISALRPIKGVALGGVTKQTQSVCAFFKKEVHEASLARQIQSPIVLEGCIQNWVNALECSHVLGLMMAHESEIVKQNISDFNHRGYQHSRGTGTISGAIANPKGLAEIALAIV
jgi:hypothetical protein